MASSFDTLFKNGSSAPPPSAPAEEVVPSSVQAPAQESSSFENLFSKSPAQKSSFEDVFSTVGGAAPAPASTFASAAPSSNESSFNSLFSAEPQEAKFGDVLTNEERAYGQKSPDEMEDEPWYSKAWNWMNSPLWDLHKYGTSEGAGTFERGLETGLETLGSSITSPLSLGLMLATFGGSAIENVGLSALKGIGVSELAAPVVVRSAKLLMDGGFTYQMLGGLMTQAPQFLDALKDGDVEEATRLGTEALGSAAFLTLAAKHGIEDAKGISELVKKSRGIDTQTITEKLSDIAKIGGIYDENVSRAGDNARAKVEDLQAKLKEAGALTGNKEQDAIRQAGIRHYVATNGNVDLMGKMLGISEGTIKPRELTKAELDTQDKAAELRSWAKDSSALTKESNQPGAAPKVFYATDSAAGTDKLGQTLETRGDDSNAHYIQVKNPYITSTKESLDGFIERSGGQEEAKKFLQDAGHDGIIYNTADPKFIAFDKAQTRPVPQNLPAAKQAWNRDYVYVAVDGENANIVKNAGIGKNPSKMPVQYSVTPEEAVEKATLPDSGHKSNMKVFAVPRAEVEATVPAPTVRAGDVDKNGDFQVALHDQNGKAIGKTAVTITNGVAHVNESNIEQQFRGQGYGKAAYIEAMRVAKENGAKYFSNDESGATSLGARQVWNSLIKTFKGEKVHKIWDATDEKVKNQPLSALQNRPAAGEEPEILTRYVIDLSQVPDKALQASELKFPRMADDALMSRVKHMPSHEIEMQDGVPTGRTVALRPEGAEGLPSDNSRFNNSYTPAEAENYRAGLRAGMNLNPKEIEIAKDLRSTYDNSFIKANFKGLVREWVQAYHPQAWKMPEGSFMKWLTASGEERVANNEALNQLRHDTDSGQFDTNVNAAKHRAYATEFQGIMAGQKFETDDLTTHLGNHLNSIDKAIAARDFIDQLRAKGVKAQDGRPAAVLSGTARRIGGAENPAVAFNGQAVRPINISPEAVEKLKEGIDSKYNMSDLEHGLQNGTIVKLPWTVEDDNGVKSPAYAYSTENYVAIDHPSMRAWGYAGQDTAGKPALMQGEILIHPDMAKYVRRVLGAEDSIVQNSKAGRGLLKVSREGKGLLLSMSPFHIIQEGIRALLVGINPFKYDHININDNPSLQRGVRNGLTRDLYKAKDQLSTGFAGHSSIIEKIPGLNHVQDELQSFLFDRYIHGLKDRAYLKLYDDVLAQNPKLTPDEAASRAADMTNDTFGGQNWRKLGVSASQQDFMKLSALAPDWLVSEVRMGMRAAGMMDKETAAISRKQMAIQIGSVWAACRVLNMLTTGQLHAEAPFGVVHKDEKGNDTVYSVRMLPTDLLHILTDTRGFIAGRVNPLTVRPIIEGVSGRDAFGRRVGAEDQGRDVARNFLPIAVQSLVKGNELPGLDQLAKAGGLSTYRYRTEAEKLSDQYSSDRMPTGPRDAAETKKHEQIVALEDAYRAGKVTRGALVNQIGVRRADEIVSNASLTPLQSKFKRLPMDQKLAVWASATPTEKAQLHTILWKYRQEWLDQHPQAERENEPVWRRMQDAFGDLR